MHFDLNDTTLSQNFYHLRDLKDINAKLRLKIDKHFKVIV